MEQRSSYAAVKDAQINPYVEGSVGDTGGSALLTTTLLLLDQNSKILPLLTYHIRPLPMCWSTEVLILLEFLERLSSVKKS